MTAPQERGGATGDLDLIRWRLEHPDAGGLDEAYRLDVPWLLAQLVEREAQIAELEQQKMGWIRSGQLYAKDAQILVASLETQLEAMRGVLEQIAKPTNPEWHSAQRARAALDGQAQPQRETGSQ